MTHVSPVDLQHVEGVKEWPFAPEQQILEVRPKFRLQAADLPVENCGVSAYRMGDFLRQLRPGLEDVHVARHEFTAMAPHVRQGAEAIELRLEQEIGMVERLRNAQEPHSSLWCK